MQAAAAAHYAGGVLCNVADGLLLTKLWLSNLEEEMAAPMTAPVLSTAAGISIVLLLVCDIVLLHVVLLLLLLRVLLLLLLRVLLLRVRLVLALVLVLLVVLVVLRPQLPLTCADRCCC
jgi:hypothetical protein